MTHQHQRAAIVTGGSRGIGAAIARRLAQDGIAVAINYASGRAAADALVAEVEAAGGHAIAVQADLAAPATPPRLFDAPEPAFVGISTISTVLCTITGLSAALLECRSACISSPAPRRRYPTCCSPTSASGSSRCGPSTPPA